MSAETQITSAKKWTAPFFTIWTAQAFSLLGSQLVQFALIWWLTKTTGSATILATASLVGLLPQVLLGPFVGTLVDRWNRRLTMIVADSTIALATLAIALLFAIGKVEIWHIFLLMFVRSVAGGFHWPAMSASTSLMVPGEHLARIQGLNQMLGGGMNIISAPLGALLLEVLPMQGILAIDVVTALIAVTPLFFIAVPQHSNGATSAGVKNTYWSDFRAGLSYVAGWPGLVMILIMATVINFLLNPAFAFLPLLVRKYFGGEAIQLAWMESALGIGIVIGGLLLGIWGGFKRRVMTSLTGLVGMGIGCLAMGLLPDSALSIAIGTAFFIGFFNPITNGPLMAAMQAVVAPEMQGRVFTLTSSVAAGMSPIGLIIAGPVADTFGPQSWFLVGGVVTILMALTAQFIPAIIYFEQGRVERHPQETVMLQVAPAQIDD